MKCRLDIKIDGVSITLPFLIFVGFVDKIYKETEFEKLTEKEKKTLALINFP